MPSTASAARALQEQAALWSVGDLRATDVVAAACDALVAGLDGPALRALAACTRAEASYDVPEILPSALAELGLTFYPVGSDAGQEAAVRVLAARMLAGRLTPRELTSRVHQLVGHELPPAQRLAELDDEYDDVDYAPRPTAQIDAEVTAEARRLARQPHP